MPGRPLVRRVAPAAFLFLARTHRYFLHFEPAGWDIRSQATGPGCAGAPPGFPKRLCEDLPAQ